MVMECPVYSLECEELLDQLSDFCTIPIDNKYETFIILMSYANGDTEIAKFVCEFVKNALKGDSQSMLSQHKSLWPK